MTEVADGGEGALELYCPACGALIEADDMATLIVRARAHTLDAHGYDVPDEHVIESARRLEE